MVMMNDILISRWQAVFMMIAKIAAAIKDDPAMFFFQIERKTDCGDLCNEHDVLN